MSPSTRSVARRTALGAAVVVLVAAVACGVLLAIPTTQSETRTLEVTQEGRFTYTGEAVAGVTYPTGVLSTGDTVWNRLVDDLTVSLTTTVTGRDLADLSGALRLDVVIAAPDGWTAVVNRGAASALQDGTATAAVAVDTGAAVDLLDRHNQETGSAGGSATLTVTRSARSSAPSGGRASRPTRRLAWRSPSTRSPCARPRRKSPCTFPAPGRRWSSTRSVRACSACSP